jgi:glycopeptide antibiotics resistance protein
LLFSRPVIALCIYLFYVATLTLSPFHFSCTPEWRASTLSLQDVDGVDIVLNTVGFGVFGIILYWLRPGKERTLFKLCVAVSCAGVLSTIIECLQIYIPARHAQIMDVLTNTIGGGIGFLLASYVHRKSWHLTLARLRNTLAIIGIASYVTGLFILFMVTVMPQRLDSWDRRFPLLIGNEATLNRPWLGNISSLMIFDRVLNQNEISSIFSIGRWSKQAVERKYQPIVAYYFDEGIGKTVHDRSQIGEPINMQITSLERTAWLPEGGLRLLEPTVLRGVRASEKLFRRITATDTFSVSMWFQPTSLEQYGPARIVSFSESPFDRNFTIGQQGASLCFRVRDRLSGSNGIRFGEVEVSHAVRSVTEPMHGVFVYEEGIKRVYIDGKEVLEEYPPDWLAVIAWFLHLDSALTWQKWILESLLVGGVGILLWPLVIPRH